MSGALFTSVCRMSSQFHSSSKPDLIVTAPEKLGAALSQRLAIRVAPHPLKLPEFQVNQFWHRRFRDDAASKWLRGVFTTLFRE